MRFIYLIISNGVVAILSTKIKNYVRIDAVVNGAITFYQFWLEL